MIVKYDMDLLKKGYIWLFCDSEECNKTMLHRPCIRSYNCGWRKTKRVYKCVGCGRIREFYDTIRHGPLKRGNMNE